MATKNRIVHRLWIIQITTIPRDKISKQNCLRFLYQERMGVERKGLLVAQKTPKTPVITGNSGFWRVSGNGAVQPPCNRESREKAVWLHRGDFNGSQWLTAKSRKTCINCYLSQFVLTTDWLFFYAKKIFWRDPKKWSSYSHYLMKGFSSRQGAPLRAAWKLNIQIIRYVTRWEAVLRHL